MSWKINKKNPTRRQGILNRRKKYNRFLPTAALMAYLGSKYIPGNGPQHRLGKTHCEEYLAEQKRRLT